MFEQLDLAAAPVAEQRAPSPWAWARAKWPDSPVVRLIDLRAERQAFVQLAFEAGLFIDGSTHFVNHPPRSLTAEEQDAITAEYDAAWWNDPNHGQRA